MYRNTLALFITITVLVFSIIVEKTDVDITSLRGFLFKLFIACLTSAMVSNKDPLQSVVKCELKVHQVTSVYSFFIILCRLKYLNVRILNNWQAFLGSLSIFD